MHVVETIEALRIVRRQLQGRVGLVPTMGALHEGHLSLVQTAKAENDCVVVTIFVNPTQFGPNEDFAAYPRDLPRDLAMLEHLGVDLVVTPTPALMYPPGFQTYIDVEHVSQGLEGERRPGHFRGVATIVAKLFNLTQPDSAYFGQKDAQQVAVLRTLVHDLNFPLDLQVMPTLREASGLALSSRNSYLTSHERQAAPVLFRALQTAGETYAAGNTHPDALRKVMLDVLNTEPLARVDYVSVADARTLRESDDEGKAPFLLSMAVRLGHTRLIDNMLVPLELNTRKGLQETLGAG
ncbi:MAG: pantoate--beta-alanine ligase [bacterium]|nr:pantoate--beta-alanine ligase [bacterium]